MWGWRKDSTVRRIRDGAGVTSTHVTAACNLNFVIVCVSGAWKCAARSQHDVSAFSSRCHCVTPGCPSEMTSDHALAMNTVRCWPDCTAPNTLGRRGCVSPTTRSSRTENLRCKVGCCSVHPTRYGWSNTTARHVSYTRTTGITGLSSPRHAEEGQEERYRRQPRSCWVCPWRWSERRLFYGHCDRLMSELRTEDQASFFNLLRMSPERDRHAVETRWALLERRVKVSCGRDAIQLVAVNTQCKRDASVMFKRVGRAWCMLFGFTENGMTSCPKWFGKTAASRHCRTRTP